MRRPACRYRSPCRVRSAASSPEKVRISVAAMISNSSARDWLKCSHKALDCATPSASSSCLSSGTHDPHDVPAAVHALSAGTSAHPSAMPHFRSPLVTLLQEQICAESGSAPIPKTAAPSPDCAGAIRASGSPGSSLPTMGRNTPYDDASPTRTPPSRVLASSESTSLAYVRLTASLMTTSRQFSVVPIASPKLATSTPSSFSLVDRSASGNSAAPSSSRSATTSALVYPGPTRP